MRFVLNLSGSEIEDFEVGPVSATTRRPNNVALNPNLLFAKSNSFKLSSNKNPPITIRCSRVDSSRPPSTKPKQMTSSMTLTIELAPKII
ncbi:unnamed protein product [Arabidopsis lyrata]|nr:unnamed protein product [Arabidopsis lyrata]